MRPTARIHTDFYDYHEGDYTSFIGHTSFICNISFAILWYNTCSSGASLEQSSVQNYLKRLFFFSYFTSRGTHEYSSSLYAAGNQPVQPIRLYYTRIGTAQYRRFYCVQYARHRGAVTVVASSNRHFSSKIFS